MQLHINLLWIPGSTDEAGIGSASAREPNLDHLCRRVEYAGPAWYQRDLEVPAGGKNKRISLFLE